MTASGAIPLGTEAYKRGLNPEVELRNLILEEDRSGASPDKIMRLQRPGLTTQATGLGVVRGLFKQDGVFSGQTFGVWGSTFGTVTSGVTSLGAVANDGGLAPFAATFEQVVFVAASTAYSWNGTVLATVAMPDGIPAIDVETLNGYVIYPRADGRFYWVVPGAVNPDPLDFATAESSPDGLVGVCRLGDELWFFGRETIEVWQTTGDANAPFQRAPGRQFDRGCLNRDTIWRFDNSLFWVGEDFAVYRADSVPAISDTFSIEEKIQAATGAVSAFTCQMLNHKFYVLTVPGQGSFAFDPSTKLWCRFSTGADDLWEPRVYAGGLFGSSVDGGVSSASATAYTDDGIAIRRIVSGTLALLGKPQRFDSMTVGAGCTDDFTIQVRWKDGQDDYPAYYEPLDMRAPYDMQSLYRMGAPDLPLRTYEFLITDPVGVRLSGAVLGSGWQ